MPLVRQTLNMNIEAIIAGLRDFRRLEKHHPNLSTIKILPRRNAALGWERRPAAYPSLFLTAIKLIYSHLDETRAVIDAGRRINETRKPPPNAAPANRYGRIRELVARTQEAVQIVGSPLPPSVPLRSDGRDPRTRWKKLERIKRRVLTGNSSSERARRLSA